MVHGGFFNRISNLTKAFTIASFFFLAEIIKLISSKISLLNNIDPITDCSASMLFGSSSALLFKIFI